MADVPEKSVQFAGAGQPSNAQTTPEPGQQGAGEQQAEQGNKYLTAEEAQRLFDDLFNRRSKSLSAKTENRVRKVIEAAQAKGCTMTEQQAEAALSVMDNERQQPQTQPQGAQPTNPPPQARKAAIEAKQQRLSMAGDPARIPSLSGSGRPGNPVTQIKDPNELWKLARQKGK
jgi:polyhydroxyalkanoate synthesis regulator phasin